MIKLLIFGLLGIGGIIALIIRNKRAENLNNLAANLSFTRLKEGELESDLWVIIKRTFLFAKGDFFSIPSSYIKMDEHGTEYMMDWVFSSTGNADITYQRIVLIFKLDKGDLPPFVIESIDTMGRVTSKDLEVAGFKKITTLSSKTFLKTNANDKLERSFGSRIRNILKDYENICIEYHAGYLFVYQNTSGKIKNGLLKFYSDTKKALIN